MYQRTMTGARRRAAAASEEIRDLDRREVGILAPLCLALVLFGFYPMPLLDVINPYVEDTLQQVGVTDPRRRVQAARRREDSSDRARDRHRSASRTSSTLSSGRCCVVFGAACLGVLVEAFVPRERRYARPVRADLRGRWPPPSSASASSADDLPRARRRRGAAACSAPRARSRSTARRVPVGTGPGLRARRRPALRRAPRSRAGSPAFAGQAAALPGHRGRAPVAPGLDHTEVYPLLLFAVGGMMLFPAAGDLLTMFVALEVLSLPLYLLCGLARRRRLLSQEAAMKYFLLGAFSSGFFLYGVALVYGYAGSMDFGDDQRGRPSTTPATRRCCDIGMGMLAVGLLFKVGAAPFQAWMPDVYQGAPTAVTAFMAAATKAAAFGAMLRLFYVAFGSARWTWQPMMWVIAILTMVVGTVLAIVQTDMKRMLAYSSVAHTGFLLTGVLGLQSVGRDPLRPDHLAPGGAVLPRHLRPRHARRLRRRRRWSATARASSRRSPAGPAWASTRRWSPASSRCSCWRWPASR